jgi:hypothetical protein
VIRVVCSHKDCRLWAVAFTTLEDNPRPWTEIPDGFMGAVVRVPLWYTCRKHSTPLHKPLPDGEEAPVCELCGKTDGIKWTGGGTAYPHTITVWDWIVYGPEGPPNPNRNCAFCPEHAEEYHEHWDEQWAELRSMQGR